jgi:cysteine-rich repeat protein
MFKKINFLKSISLIALFIAFFTLAISAYASCNFGGGKGGFGGWNGWKHERKVDICHFDHGKSDEMSVNFKDLNSYLKHGDHIGKCPRKDKDDDKDHDKITICHIPGGNVSKEMTIIIDKNALKAHLAHGDYVGKCKTPVPPVCGNGLLQTGEQCDDGNLLNNDGCSSTCKLEICGDGVKQTNEQCDDGNLINGDGCDSTCKIEGPANEAFAEGVLTAITKNGAQTGEADLNLATNTFAKIILNCAAWNACSLQLVRSSDTNPYTFSATFDTGTLSAEQCDVNGVCTANSTFVMPAVTDPVSISLSFTDTAGTSSGNTTILLTPSSDTINVSGNVGVVTSAGANMLTIGEAEASAESNAKVTNIATAKNGALVSSSQSLMGSYEHSSGETKNQSIASGTGAISATNDTVGANINATVNHNVVSNGTGTSALSSCSITSKSDGDSLATLDALAQDGAQTADSVNHQETLNDPGASVIVHANCGDVQF